MYKITRPIREAKSTTGSSREKDIKLLQEQIHERDNIILTQKNELAALSKTIKNLQNDDRTLKDIDNRWKEFQTFMQAAMKTKLEVENRSLIFKYENLLETSRSIGDVLRKTENDLADSRKRESQAKDSLRDIQASAFRFQDRPQWSPDSDDAVRQQLTSLEKHAKAWCRVNCVKMLPHLGTLPANLLHEWEAVLRYDAKIFARHDQHLPQLILQALLMDCIYGEIFANSFFFLPWRVQSQAVEEGEEAGADLTARRDQNEVMTRVLQEITQGNLEEGNSWRCNFLRLLDPKPKGDEAELRLLEDTKNRTEMAREAAASSLMDGFLGTSAAFLISSNPVERTAVGNLRQIFVTAAHLSYKLWLRKSYLEVQTIKRIPDVYRHNLGLLRAHSLHNAFLEDDEAGLDGYPVRVVVHPALIVRGSSDGTNLETTRVWKEAVVWMG